MLATPHGADSRATSAERTKYLVYVIRTDSGWHYVGCTQNVDESIKAHRQGLSSATRQIADRDTFKFVSAWCFNVKPAGYMCLEALRKKAKTHPQFLHTVSKLSRRQLVYQLIADGYYQKKR